MADPVLRQSSGARSLPAALAQTIYLLLGMLAVSGVAGVLMAAFFVPAVSVTSSVAEDGVALFESYPTELKTAPLNEASRIEAADGTLLATFYSENRVMVPLEEISEHMQNAVVAVEDRRFYEHGGVDMRGMARAFASNSVGSGGTQGGSTLTQQYVKNALLMDAVQRNDKEDIAAATEQTYGRKLREAKLALALESDPNWSKDKILNAYLNVAQFGPSQYGVETGAQHYFSKSAKDLDPGEAALLAGITNGPNQYDPVAHPKAGKQRRNEVLRDMHRDGYIDDEQLDKYTKQNVKDQLKVKNVRAGCADAGRNGFFCDYVTRTLLNDPEFAPTPEERRKLLYGGGLTIKTTLDPKRQKMAVDLLEERVPAKSEHGFGHSIVTVEPGTGKVLVMAQNRTFNPYENPGPGETAINYNVPNALGGSNGFPVGSTFKPFVLQQWLKSGKSIYDRVGTEREKMPEFPAKCLGGGSWREYPGYDPDNAVSVRLGPSEEVMDVTKWSVNTSYARMARELDLCDIADGARDLGVVPAPLNPYDDATWSGPIEDVYKTELAPSVVVLGEVRISALDMAASYATWAARGTYCRPTPITEITDRNGEPMSITGAQCEEKVDPKIADTMAWVLQKDLADPDATGQGKVIPGYPAGGKTGTSGQQFHTWYVGFTRQLSTAVWFGHPSGNVRPQNFMVGDTFLRPGKVWGNTVSLPTWQTYMTEAMQGMESKPFPGEPARPTPPPAGEIEEGKVPNVSNMVLSQAQSTLERAGYQVKVERVGGTDVEQWRVIDTDPRAGTELPRGSTVTIRQSDGR